jgi:glycosyltransferase involved in cell wall biosynthesis
LMQSADLFALPGTGGLALQEAMANALPVIAAEGDGTQADLVGEENGWLIPPGDLDQMVHALAEAFNNRERLRAMGKVSFEIVREQANIGVMVDVFLQAFHSVILEH